MSIFDKLDPIVEARRQMIAGGVDPLGLPVDEVLSASEAIIDGRRTVLAGTNNYLGLTFDAECIEAGVRAQRTEGTGTTGSRMANGSYSGHLALERELAAFYGTPQAIVFSTGYQANLGMLAALCDPREVVLLDADCHASIYDGVRLGGAQVQRFRHNNPDDLGKRLRRLGERAAGAMVVVEGIYSMLGDPAPLAAIVEIARAQGAYLYVDEAHSMGVLGATGRGLAQAVGVEDQVDFSVGTFSKSLGAIGGFCVSRHAELDIVRYASRPYIFTASPSPASIASTRVALGKLGDGAGLRARLWANAHRLYDGLQRQGFKLGPEPGPVVAAVLDDNNAALGLWQGLLERGVYVNLMLPPATPNAESLVRCSVSAAHTTEQIDWIVDAFRELKPVAAASA